MKIWREKAEVISPNPCWVAYHRGYLYIGNTLLELLWVILTEWENDQHLVGP